MIYLSDAERKLGFLGMEGYDIFGKNAYFAPRLRYDELEKDVTDLKTSAAAYETSFNEVMKIENLNKNFKLVSVRKPHYYYASFDPVPRLNNRRF